MKALSIREPWATLIATDQKTIECRTWATSYRGEILLCASKSPESAIAGHAFAICRIADCRVLEIDDWQAAGLREGDIIPCDPGDKDVFAWMLSDIRLISPVPVKGKRGLFEVAY